MSFTPGHQTVIEQKPIVIEEKIREDCCDLCRFIDSGRGRQVPLEGLRSRGETLFRLLVVQ